MEISELYQRICCLFGMNKAIRINNEDKNLPDDSSIVKCAKEQSAAFQTACMEFKNEYEKLQSPTQDEQTMFVDVQRMKKEHGV